MKRCQINRFKKRIYAVNKSRNLNAYHKTNIQLTFSLFSTLRLPTADPRRNEGPHYDLTLKKINLPSNITFKCT